VNDDGYSEVEIAADEMKLLDVAVSLIDEILGCDVVGVVGVDKNNHVFLSALTGDAEPIIGLMASTDWRLILRTLAEKPS
jgi:hypothetical protein